VSKDEFSDSGTGAPLSRTARSFAAIAATGGAAVSHWLWLNSSDAFVLPYIGAILVIACFGSPVLLTVSAILGAAAAVTVHGVFALPLTDVRFLLGLVLFGLISIGIIHLRAAYIGERRRRVAAEQSRELLREELAAERVTLERVQQQVTRQARIAAIDRLSSSLAHDLRNPLGVIRNSVYLLRRRLSKLDVKTDLLDVIEDEVKGADAVLTNLTESTNGREPIRTDVDLLDLVRQLTTHIDSSGRVQWTLDALGGSFVVWCDPGQLRRVLSNLLQNAVEAMKGRGAVTVAGWTEGPLDFVEIRDSGPGVAPEIRPALFEPLATTKRGRSGLGLLTCRQLLERHGGTIDLVDRAESGAAFRITLPRKPAQPVPVTGAVTDRPADFPLVVE
jgi:signal transduction histidine kinase